MVKDPWLKITKKKRRLDLYSGKSLVKSYRIVLGQNPSGDKIKEGDGRTPEGEFYICTKNPKSKYHCFMGISYPDTEDAERGLDVGLIDRGHYHQIMEAHKGRGCPPWDTPLGGDIGLHGGGTNRTRTRGCIGLKNKDIEELYQTLQFGDKVVIEK